MTNQTDNSNDNDHSKNENDSDNLDFSNPIITSANNSASNNNDVCRDYLRNTCRRGANCKFSHPESSDPKKYDIPLLTFCHDFQNRECKRNNCKFVHCSKQEEETYKATGKLPPNVNYDTNGLNAPTKQQNGNQNNHNNKSNSNPHQNNSQNNNQNNQSNNHNNKFNKNAQICKDFVKGDCFRGQRCKFRHVKNEAQERNSNNNNSNNNTNNNNNSNNNKNHIKNQNNSNNNYEPDQFDKQYANNNFQSNNNPSNFENRFMVQQRLEQFNQLKPNSMANPMNRNDNNQFQMSIDRRNMRSIFEPEPKRRAFDTGFNTPTTFTFANNANNQLCVTNALNHQMLSNHSNSNPNGALGTSNSDPTPQTNSVTNCSNAAQSALAAAIAINELNSSNVSTSVASNTITRSMYSNLNENRFLLEENNSLRRKIDELKQQVVDLMNANEFLLEQNAQLRSSRLPTTSVNQNVQVSTTLHNSVVASALHSNAVVQPKPPTNNQGPTSSQGIVQTLPHINTSTISNQQLANQTATDLLVANHLHIQNQQRAVGVASATSSALSTNPLNNPLSAVSSMSSLTSTSTSTPLVSYPIMTGSSIPASIHSLGHLTH